MPIPTFTWPDWRTAPEGTRFRNNRTGRTGTFIRPARCKHNGGIVVWDDVPFPIHNPVVNSIPNSVNFVSIASDAMPIKENHES